MFSKLKNFLVVVLSLLIIFIILELVSKQIRINRAGSTYIVTDPILHHRWKENLNIVNKRPKFKLVTNSKGWLENYEVKKKKERNTYRIFCVGDSNTQGLVDDEYKTCSSLEAKLNNHYKSLPINFEIINTGTSSYSTLIYYLLIRDYLTKYNPDMVILNIDMTDVPNDYFYNNFIIKDEKEKILAITPQKDTQDIKYELTPTGYREIRRKKYYSKIIQNSDLLYLVERAISRLIWKWKLNPNLNISQNYNEANWLKFEWDDKVEKNVIFSMSILDKITDLSIQENFDLVVTSIPHLDQFKGKQSDQPHKVVKSTIQKNNGNYFNLYKILGQKKNQEELSKLYLKNDPTHFNQSGNKVWADLLFEYVIQRQLY